MNANTLKLLLIEDEPSLIGLFEQMLAWDAEPHFELHSATHLAQGLKRLARGGIDAVVLDLELPDSQSLASLNHVLTQTPEVPVVVLTGLQDEKTALRAMREGAQDYLLKGEVNRPRLVQSIRYAIERKRGEEARSRLAAIVESCRDAIIGMSLDGVIVSWNPGAERIFGYPSEEVIGRSISILEQAGESAGIAVLLDRVRQGKHVADFEAVRLRNTGESFHIAASVSPIRNFFGKATGLSMIARDIEERFRAQQERENLVRELQASLAQVNTLRGLLPICSCCKKIRDDHGHWTQFEVFLRERSQTEFTHGICPECLDQYRAGVSSDI